ncbi:MAG: hypothetical protein ACHRXM_18635 [Isosphaerales bacterium]
MSADDRQNKAVMGTAADLAAAGFGALNGKTIAIGQLNDGAPNRDCQ